MPRINTASAGTACELVKKEKKVSATCEYL